MCVLDPLFILNKTVPEFILARIIESSFSLAIDVRLFANQLQLPAGGQAYRTWHVGSLKTHAAIFRQGYIDR